MTTSEVKPKHAQRTIIILLTCLVLMAVGLWFAGTHIRSSRAAAASAAPPPHHLITAPVVSAVVSATVNVAGAVTSGSPQAISAPTLDGAVAAVVTNVAVAAGDIVRPGQLLADVSGHPIIALPGSFPMYRPFTVGIAGPDVTELQAALAATGAALADPPGVLGNSTMAALAGLYEKDGYALQGPAPSVGVGEVVFIDHLPAAVANVNTPTGSPVAGQPILTISSGKLGFEAALGSGEETGVKPGQPATVRVQGSPTTFRAKVASVDVPAANSDTSGPTVVLSADTPVAPDLAGETATIVITVSTTGKAVVAVPISALRTAPDGSAFVSVPTGNDSKRDVAVVPGDVGDGLVEIERPATEIAAGNLVVVGNDAGSL